MMRFISSTVAKQKIRETPSCSSTELYKNSISQNFKICLFLSLLRPDNGVDLNSKRSDAYSIHFAICKT